MKDYKNITVDYKSLENVLSSTNTGADIIPGNLLDNYFSDNFYLSLKIGGRPIKARKHMFALEKFINSQTSRLEMTLTDNDKFYYQQKLKFIDETLRENTEREFLDYEQRIKLEGEKDTCIYQLSKI